MHSPGENFNSPLPSAPAFLYLWPGKFLYAGSSVRTKVHGHHAMQIAMSTSRPFRMKLGSEWENFQAVIIKPDFPHECILEDKQVIFLGLDPESTEAVALEYNYLEGKPYRTIDDPVSGTFIAEINAALQLDPGSSNIARILNNFFFQLKVETQQLAMPDDRLMKVTSFIREAIPGKMRLRDLAAEACISEGRLVHLFKQQIGIPIRSYILWTRLIHAVYSVVNGASMTEAAHRSGFADSAHFSRVFLRMLGVPPTGLLKNSQNFQAFLCEE
jgi:AraC-like DNA-binding protein